MWKSLLKYTTVYYYKDKILLYKVERMSDNFNTITFEESLLWSGNSRPRVRTVVGVQVVSRIGVSSYRSVMSDMYVHRSAVG